MTILAIYRAERFSPNAADRDRAIMDAICDIIGKDGKRRIVKVSEEEFATSGTDSIHADGTIHMARSREALMKLQEMERTTGTEVVNSPSRLLNMSRSAIEKAMRRNNIPAAPLYGKCGWWIKRGDQAAQEKGDVMFAANDTERDAAIRDFQKRGIEDIVVTAHVMGDLVKFYGVRGSRFFFCCYPTDGGYSKFGDEKHNGTALHTPFNRQSLNNDAEKLAGIMGIDVYGGDCIVRGDGSYAIIDFNDFPSFAACRSEAAEAIARLMESRIMEQQANKTE